MFEWIMRMSYFHHKDDDYDDNYDDDYDDDGDGDDDGDDDDHFLVIKIWMMLAKQCMDVLIHSFPTEQQQLMLSD